MVRTIFFKFSNDKNTTNVLLFDIPSCRAPMVGTNPTAKRGSKDDRTDRSDCLVACVTSRQDRTTDEADMPFSCSRIVMVSSKTVPSSLISSNYKDCGCFSVKVD